MDTCTLPIVQAPAGPAEHTAAAAAARAGGPDQRPHWRRRRDHFAAGEHGQQHIGWAESGVGLRSGIAAMQLNNSTRCAGHGTLRMHPTAFQSHPDQLQSVLP